MTFAIQGSSNPALTFSGTGTTPVNSCAARTRGLIDLGRDDQTDLSGGCVEDLVLNDQHVVVCGDLPQKRACQ